MSVIPECIYQESKLFRGQDYLDSRLKISGMTNDVDA